MCCHLQWRGGLNNNTWALSVPYEEQIQHPYKGIHLPSAGSGTQSPRDPELGICEYIDRLIPKKRSHLVTHGQSVKALLLNCLGFTERRLYLMPEYFDDVATERLIGDGIEAQHLNQYLFGETPDAIAAAGPTELFTGIILEILDNLLQGVLRLHYD